MRRDYDDDDYEAGGIMEDFPSRGSGTQQNTDTLRFGYPWVQHFLREHPGYEFVDYSSVPEAVQVPDLSEARVALISMAGIYTEAQKAFSISPGEVEPEYLAQRFREMGDSSLRVISNSAEPSTLRIAYPYLDVSGADEDINTVFPITRLQELEEESFIESIADTHLSFMGYLPNPVGMEELTESAVNLFSEDDVNLVLLTPADVLSHQTMAILQRGVESAGIATISVALCRDLIASIGVPRAVHYRFPFGYTFGGANDETMQLRILKETLSSGQEIDEAGTIVDLPYEWMDL
jgi:D-proline reductase (dithiol) PrdB